MHNFTISGLDSLVVLSQYLCHQCSAVLFLPCSTLSVGNCWSAAAVCSSSSPWLGPCRQHTTWTPTSSATPPSSPGSPTLSSPFKPQDLNSTLPGHWVSIVCGICGSVMVNQLSAGSVLGTRVPLLSSYTLCFFCFFFPSVRSADAVNNAAGYGFLGMDENGKPSWDLICNLNILGIEVPSVFHMNSRTWSICLY